MASLKEEYQSFLADIEKNMKNKEDLDYVKARFAVFLNVVVDQMDMIINFKEDKMKELEEAQKNLVNKLDKMQQVIDNIEKDIYAEDGFDFEIVCPYRNYQFLIDVDENRTEVECPECGNTIELDWSGDYDEEDRACHGECDGCNGCNEENEQDDEEQNDVNDEDM